MILSLCIFSCLLVHRGCYLSCCSISCSARWRKKKGRPQQKIKCFWRRRKGSRRPCCPWSPLTLWVENPSRLVSCIRPKPGLAGELRADGRHGMYLCVSVYIHLCNKHSHVPLCSAGCVKPTLTAPAWWAWVRPAVCVCGSSGAGGPRGWCGLLRVKAGSWLDGEEEVHWWLDITMETLLYTATVPVRLHSATNIKDSSITFIKYDKILSSLQLRDTF